MPERSSDSSEKTSFAQHASTESQGEPLAECQLETETWFYQDYPWCLNPSPTVREVVAYLEVELERLGKMRQRWHVSEVMTNVFLLSCALLNSAEDYLNKPNYKVPTRAVSIPLLRSAIRAAKGISVTLRQAHLALVRQWMKRWEVGFDSFLRFLVTGTFPDPETLALITGDLRCLLRSPFPADLQREHIRIPSSFRKQDLTHIDIVALARKLVDRFADRRQPILIIGIRTVGSYAAPVLRAFLRAEGFQTVHAITVRPKKGLTAWERAELTACAGAGYLGVVFDEPPFTGSTVALAFEQARRAGFNSDRLVGLMQVDSLRANWRTHIGSILPSGAVLLSLELYEWHKYRLLAPEAVQMRLLEYFRQRQYSSVSVVASPLADEFNRQLQLAVDDVLRHRLKRVYAVRLEDTAGKPETRYVLAKSVGWGWLGYHSFLAGKRLAGLVPPVLGLRDGILYSEWLPQRNRAGAHAQNREQWIEAVSSYVAARARHLGLKREAWLDFGLDEQHEGFELLTGTLSAAYGGVVTAALMRGRIRHRLADQTCPFPTLIDGKMHRSEWIAGTSALLKTDFEHHGLGKKEVNVIDPAYDLADAILQLRLSLDDERKLIRRYIDETGDEGAEERLFLNKLLAGSWALACALRGLVEQPQLSSRGPEFNEQYVRAWDFLTAQTVRFCASYTEKPQALCWRSPLAVLDIDGVLDRRIFGFPSTTAAGIRALSLLHSHGFAIAVNTARSIAEVKEYCDSYGFVGGVAEYGSYIWNPMANEGRGLVSTESLGQLEELRQALRHLPGIFLNDSYEYSIRAYTYEQKGTVPIPALMIQNLMSSLKLDRLQWHQTTTDTTVVAAEVDKGLGLTALLAWVGKPELQTVAIGDSHSDLPMFRVAKRSFAPAHITCADLATSLGCQIARKPYQLGLLEIVLSLIHPQRDTCRECPPDTLDARPSDELFLELLRAADQNRVARLFRAMLDPKCFRVFVQ